MGAGVCVCGWGGGGSEWAENRGQGVIGIFFNRFGSNFHQTPNF